jgi:hypothetical protein
MPGQNMEKEKSQGSQMHKEEQNQQKEFKLKSRME